MCLPLCGDLKITAHIMLDRECIFIPEWKIVECVVPMPSLTIIYMAMEIINKWSENQPTSVLFFAKAMFSDTCSKW